LFTVLTNFKYRFTVAKSNRVEFDPHHFLLRGSTGTPESEAPARDRIPEQKRDRASLSQRRGLELGKARRRSPA
jgi:hypothetical protein